MTLSDYKALPNDLTRKAALILGFHGAKVGDVLWLHNDILSDFNHEVESPDCKCCPVQVTKTARMSEQEFLKAMYKAMGN